MMVNYLELPVGERAPESFRTVIEIPKDGTSKFEYDKELHVFKLDRSLHSPVHYPGDYGFIPSTLSDDGDPLDVLVLTQFPTFPGCLIKARILGMVNMSDEKGEDFKLLAVPAYDKAWRDALDIDDVPKADKDRIAHFFTVYKDLDEGKWSKVENWVGREAALAELAKSVERFTR